MGISRSREKTTVMTMTMVIRERSTRLRIYFATEVDLLYREIGRARASTPR